LDVHPVHHAPRTWRDFFLQLLMITIGLFIALMLQAAVESLHHRHLVHDARENLRHEIQINQQRYGQNLENLHKNRRQLANDIDVLKDLRAGKAIDKGALGWRWDWNSYSDASWKTTRDTGAVAYMSADLVRAFTEVYTQQEYVNQEAVGLINDEPKSAAALIVAKDPSALSPAEIQSMLISMAETDIRLGTIESLMASLNEMYTKAMKTL
jgi:hypothetical protein